MSHIKVDHITGVEKLKVFKDSENNEWYIDVAPILKTIFGKGIIKKAYIKIDVFNRDEATLLMEQIVRYYNDTKRLDYDDNDLYVIFKNDVHVRFTSSEWGTVIQIKGQNNMKEEMIRKNFKDWPICDNYDYYVGDVTEWMDSVFGNVDEAYIILGYYSDDANYTQMLQERWFCCTFEYKTSPKIYCLHGTLIMKLSNGKYFEVDIRDGRDLFIRSVD